MASIGQWRFLWGEELRDAFRLKFQTNEVITTAALGDEHMPVDVAQTKESVLQNSTMNRIQDISTQFEEPNWITTCTVDKMIHVKIQTSFDQLGCREYAHSCKKRLAGFGVISILLGIGAKQAAANSIAKTILCISAVASFILACINWRNYGGSNQLKGKSDLLPAHSIAWSREQVYERGFLYVREKNLKLGSDVHYPCLLPCEVEFLFDEYLSQYSTSLREQNPQSEEEQKAWLAAFKTNNPLSDDLFLYAKTEDQAARFTELRQEYKRLNELIENPSNTTRQAFDQNYMTIVKAEEKALYPFLEIESVLRHQMATTIPPKTQQISENFHLATADIESEFEALRYNQISSTEMSRKIEEKLNIPKEQVLLAKHLLRKAPLLTTDTNYQYEKTYSLSFDMQPACTPIEPIEERDFLKEARVKFANDAKMSEYLNTTTS